MKININQLPDKSTRIRFVASICAFILMMAVTLNLKAQNNCAQSLKLAEKKFEGGLLREVPQALSECLVKDQFSSEEKLKAYKLLTLTYLYLDDSLNAEISFYKLLSNFPDFQINNAIEPAELVNLFNTYRTLPLYSFGIQAGSNMTSVSVMNSFGIDNISQREETYLHLPGYDAGFRFDIPISKRIFITTGSSFRVLRYKNVRSLATTSLHIDGIPNNFAEVNFSEIQSWLNIPLSIGTTIGNSKVKHFIYGGASAGYLVSAKAKISRKFTYASNSGSNIKGPDINVRELRDKFNLWGIVGTGVRIKSGLNHINIEAQYDLGLKNIVDRSNRYSNSQLINRYGYLDNDIRINFFTLRGSYMFTRYKPKKIIK